MNPFEPSNRIEGFGLLFLFALEALKDARNDWWRRLIALLVVGVLVVPFLACWAVIRIRDRLAVRRRRQQAKREV